MTKLATGLRSKWPALFLFAASLVVLLHFKQGIPALYTLALALAAWLLCLIVAGHALLRNALVYLLFFVTPCLTFTGQIGILTGFGGSGASLPWLGVSFVSTSLAVHVLRGQLCFYTLWLHILQPLRFNSGPSALPSNHYPRFSVRKSRAYLGWLVLGAFFYSVPASALGSLLVLKQSTDALDIVVFALLFEAYVYFNFSGISFMVYGLLNLCGVKTVLNFKSPFAARDVIGYWQRWHISLSQILKALFFNPIRARFGLSAAVLSVFLSSALWHGVSFNFVLWGAFHAGGWLLTYRLGRHRGGRWLNVLAFPLIVVFGRLIFSESDSALLLVKFQQLLNFAWTSDAWLLHMTLDAKTALILIGTAIYLGMEIWLPRRFGGYKLMRRKWATLVLAVICLAWGNTGLEGVYGAR